MNPIIHPGDQPALLPRRQILAAVGGIGASLFIAGETAAPALAQTTFACLTQDAMTEGPYWVDEMLNRSDIRVDTSNGVAKTGTPLTLQINLFQSAAAGCLPLPNAQVDIWHCDAGGIYSDEAANRSLGQKFLRGYQMSDGGGSVNFMTIYPGWYSGRAVHIHVRVRTFSGSTLTGEFVSQFFFDDAVTDSVLGQAPYNTRGSRDTRNAVDMVYRGATHGDRSLLTLKKAADGYAASINAIMTLGPSTPAITPSGPNRNTALPQLVYGGGWYTALYLSNIASTAATAAFSFYANDGQALSVADIGAATLQVPVAANATAVVEFQNAGDLIEGWVDATLPAGVIGYAVLRQYGADGSTAQEALAPLVSESNQFPDLVYDETAFTTSVAIVNPSAQLASIVITAYQADGTQAGNGTMTLAAKSKMSAALRDLPGLAQIAGTRGRVTFNISGAVAAGPGQAAGATLSVSSLRIGAGSFANVPVNYR